MLSIFQESLVEFAWREGRSHELRDIDLTCTPLHGMPEIEAGYFRSPGTKLFHDFCAKMTSVLQHTLVRGHVTDIINMGANYEVCIRGSTDKLYAKHVVLALGTAGPPMMPAVFKSLATNKNMRPRVMHTSDWKNLAAMEMNNLDRVLVIGGGLSAAQAALLAVRGGVRHTVLCSRRPLVERHYDLPLEFMDRRGHNKWKEWFFLSAADRVQFVKRARGGGSVPPDYMQALYEAVHAKHLKLEVKSVQHATPTEDGIFVEFDDGSTFDASFVILGTGSAQDCLQVPLMASLASRYNLLMQNGLPLLDEDLQWHDRVTVVGSLASGQLGPDAGNLTGARRAASICADNIGVVDYLSVSGAILGNMYGALSDEGDDSSDDSGTSSSEEPSDSNTSSSEE